MAYQVSEGMDAAATARFLDTYTGGDIYRAVAERQGDVFPNRLIAPDPPREEETFVRWVTLETPGIAGVRRHGSTADWPLPGEEPPAGQRVRLVRLQKEGAAGGLAVSGWRCAIHRVSAAQADILAAHAEGAALDIGRRALVEPLVGRELARLDSLELIQAPEPLRRRNHPPAQIVSGYVLPFAEVDFLCLPGERCILFDRQQEKVMRLNQSGAFIWLMLGGGIRGSELLQRVRLAFGPEMTESHLAAFINRLSAEGMICVHPGVPS